MALITQSEIENRIKRPLSAEETASFTIINAAIQYEVERMIGSSVEDVAASTRYYDGGVQNLSIDPCSSITAVLYVDDEQNTESTFLSDEYTSEPINRTIKTMLRNRNARFADGFNNVAVTAKFTIYNDAGVLAVVKDAILAALESEIANTDNIKRESIEGYSVELATSETKEALSRIKYLFPGV
jgi:hypothetical protein